MRIERSLALKWALAGTALAATLDWYRRTSGSLAVSDTDR